jgi:hypothetical protein
VHATAVGTPAQETMTGEPATKTGREEYGDVGVGPHDLVAESDRAIVRCLIRVCTMQDA